MTRYKISLKIKIFTAAIFMSLLPLILTMAYLHYDFEKVIDDQLGHQLRDISLWASNDSNVLEAYNSPNIHSNLNQISEEVRRETGAYVIFLDNNGFIISHPNPSLVGSPIAGTDITPVLQGETYVSRGVGYTGPAIRAFAPIIVNSNQVGAVVAGFLEPDLTHLINRLFNSLYTILPISLIMILLLSALMAERIKNTLFGMEPYEIATKLSERNSMLESVIEGIIAVDIEQKISVVNSTAQQFFSPETSLLNKYIYDFIPGSAMTAVISTKQPVFDQQLSLNGHILLANTLPLINKGRVIGGIITFRPLKDTNKIAEELTGVKEIVKVLRARTHEFSNKLHVVIGLLRLKRYSEAENYISYISEEENSQAGFILDYILSPTVAGLLIGKISEAKERKIDLHINPESKLTSLPHHFNEHAMVVVLGNLIENAFDASLNSDLPIVDVFVFQDNKNLRITVSDNGTGIPPEIENQIFNPGFTTKITGTGWGLSNVKERVEAASGQLLYKTDKYGTTFSITIPLTL